MLKVGIITGSTRPRPRVVAHDFVHGRVVVLVPADIERTGEEIRFHATRFHGLHADLWLGEKGVAHTVAKAIGTDPDTARDKVLASIGGLATRRLTTPAEVATLAVMLASPRTGNVTGSNYVIDGGLIKTL